MTETNTAAGSSPGGVSDVRSTASVEGTLPCPCGKVRRCAFVGCLDDATVPLTTDVAYCDHHAGDIFRAHLRRAQLADLPRFVDAVIDIDDVVGQGVFLHHDYKYPKRDRITFTTFTSKSFRFGRVKCDRCGASWMGTEHELCRWCVKRAFVVSDGAK